MWYSGKLFGFVSTFASDFLINETSPEDAKGTWQGRSEASSALAEALATLVISIVYDEFNDGSDNGIRGKAALYITMAISGCAVVAYSPLLVLAPRPPPDAKSKEKRYMRMEEYEALPIEQLRKISIEEYYYFETIRTAEVICEAS